MEPEKEDKTDYGIVLLFLGLFLIVIAGYIPSSVWVVSWLSGPLSAIGAFLLIVGALLGGTRTLHEKLHPDDKGFRWDW